MDAPQKTEALVTPGPIRPGENVVLPLALLSVFKPSDLERYGSHSKTTADAAALIRQIQQIGGETIALVDPIDQRIVLFEYPIESFASSLDHRPALQPAYASGPALQLQALRVNGIKYPTRDPAFGKFHINAWGDWQIGSCPYVYVRTDQLSDWINQGTILTNVIGVDFERDDEIELFHFDGTVQIREIPGERSFIDAAWLDVYGWSGEYLRLRSEISELSIKDGVRLQLNPHDVIELNFQLPTHLSNPREVRLGVHGYYELLKHK